MSIKALVAATLPLVALATAPLLFTCVADTEDQAEFGVYPG